MLTILFYSVCMKKEYNQYYFNAENGMKLRSGKTINCIKNSKLNQLLELVLEEIKWWELSESTITEYVRIMNEYIDDSRENIKLNNYSVLFITFIFLDIYYENLYINKELYDSYKYFKNKINEFIIYFDKNKNKICDYIVEYEDWDYNCSFPIYREDYSCDIYKECINNNFYNNKYSKYKHVNFIEELYKWNYKLSIPHSSIKNNKLYRKIELFTNGDCTDNIFSYL